MCLTDITKTRCGIGPAGLPFRLDFQVTLRSTEVDRQGRQAWAGVPFRFIALAGLRVVNW